MLDHLQKFTSKLDNYKKEYESIIVKISKKLPAIEARIDENIKSVDLLKSYVNTDENANDKITSYRLGFNKQLKNVITTLNDTKTIDQEIFEELKESTDITKKSLTKIEEIDNISENLKVFAINSIVYSQQAGPRGKGYQLISGEFIKLSEELAKKTERINILGNKIESELSILIDKVKLHNKFNHDQIALITNESESLLKNSDNAIKELILRLDNLTNDINKIKEPTFDIMLQLQNQDIIHQQLEHIKELIENTYDLLSNNKEIFDDENINVDLLSIFNFLFVIIEKQLTRLNSEILSMVKKLTESLETILKSVLVINKKKENRGDFSKLIKEVFASPQDIISSINDKLDISLTQKEGIIESFNTIDEMMLSENHIAKSFIPLMEMIKNLLFLAHVEQERNQLEILIDMNDKNSNFSNKVFDEMEDIVNGIENAHEKLNFNYQRIVTSHKLEQEKYSEIKSCFNSSNDFLNKTGETFLDNYNDCLDITNSIFNEINSDKLLFRDLNEKHKEIEQNLTLLIKIKNDIKNRLKLNGGVINLNNSIYRDTIIQKVLNNLTVDDERISVLEEFPELNIEKTTGNSVTLF